MGAVTWRKIRRLRFVGLPVLGLAGIAVAAKLQDASQQTSDPVADAARKRASRRKMKRNRKKFSRMMTSHPLRRRPQQRRYESNRDKTDGKEGDTNAAKSWRRESRCDAKGDKAPVDEAGWRKRFAEQRAKISQAEQELDILQRESTKLQTQYYTDPQKALAEQYTRKDITDQDAKMQAKKDEIAKLKQGLSDLEDQLRASGGDPAGPANLRVQAARAPLLQTLLPYSNDRAAHR